MVFCNMAKELFGFKVSPVTILILIDGFLQYYRLIKISDYVTSHNPYFNRWFSAIFVKEPPLHMNMWSQSLF